MTNHDNGRSRLAAARAAYVAALEEERARIQAELDALGEGAPPPPRIRSAAVKPEKSKRAHGVPGRVGVLSDGSPTGGTHPPCPGCGRDGIQVSPGPGGYKRFHFARCGLPCAAANLDAPSVRREDLSDGRHSTKNCPRCAKRATA